MSGPEEPMLPSRRPKDVEPVEDFGARIRRLVMRQPFAVLATQGEGQPYGSVVAVAFTDDLRHVLFATPITTRKFRLLTENDRVALVIDDRSEWADDMMRIEAVTLTGRAARIEHGADHGRWAAVLVDRHPQLHAFVQSDSCALFRVDVVRYFHVERFQEVREWAPTSS